MHPAIFSAIPPRWRGLVVVIVVAIALALMFDRPVWEELKEGAVGAWLEGVINPEPTPEELPGLQVTPWSAIHEGALRQPSIAPMALPTIGPINSDALAPLPPTQDSTGRSGP